MWRRIRPIPFLNVPTDPDPDLKDYIFDPEGALPAVLAWAVEGAMKVLNSKSRDALGWCSVVANAAEVYRKNEDRIGIFLAEETEELAGEKTPVKSLFNVYRKWSEDRGERPMTQIAFHRKLVDRNMTVEGMGAKAMVHDVKLVMKAISVATEVDWYSATHIAR
jgi:phage/plasmid-associated DNA primase